MIREPWWLPKGSIRALIAVMIIGTVCYLAINSGVKLKASDIKELGIMAVTFYFVTKKNKEDSSNENHPQV